MAKTISARHPGRRPSELFAAPAQRLAPRRNPWGRDATICLAVGVAAFGAAPLMGHAQLKLPALALGALVALGRTIHGLRTQARGQLADRLVEALAPSLGMRTPDRRTVKLTSWRGRWPGTPRRVDLRYAPGVDDADPMWRADLAHAVGRRVLADYQVHSHDRRRLRLQLQMVSPTPGGPAAPAIQVRAERTLTELLGPTTVVSKFEFDDAELVAVEGQHEAGAKLAAAQYRYRVERVVSTMLPGRWRAHWDLEADTFRFEVRPTFPSNIWLPVSKVADRDLLATYDELAIPYGVDEDQQVMVWRPAVDPNVMLVGSPGTGKTVTAHTLLVQATRNGWPVWVVDGKSIEFLGFQDWPNVQVVATSIEEQVAVITRAWEVMEHRYELITSGRARETDFEPLLVFLDEWADFRGNLMAWYSEIKVKGDPTKPPVLTKAGSIGRKGRTSRVHLVFGTQRPDAEYFGGDMRDNFRMRISMGRLSPQGAMMMWESPVTGTSIPRGCRGRATTINDDNRAVEIQTYRTPDPRKTTPGSEESQLLQRLRPATVTHDRLLILPPQVDTGLDSGDVEDPTYSEYAAAEWVLASTRPDLDPVAHRRQNPAGGRDLASPMTVFGLRGTAVSNRPPPTETGGDVQPAAPVRRPPEVPPQPLDDDVDTFDGYGPPSTSTPARLSVGDLVLVDESTGLWGVVDVEPEDDIEAVSCVAVSWRSDDDDSGYLSVPDDQLLTIRRPLEPSE